ncbi:hypothetical protein K490DRAFT_52983 [Saccharata proteae CBS 121410]|uniref:Uncharacterized protein n=1 Tax=Saccharata proteae CBS 121410 TaxID=1314787 RepID=A0A9P4LZU8_9PEZI|nr:hypothetical protein K490DRAFT_52983 [Saccharata proteae CBS 121410]
MKPCPGPSAVPSRPPINTCHYINYTALLLMRSSALLVKLGTAGMEPRPNQQPDTISPCEDDIVEPLRLPVRRNVAADRNLGLPHTPVVEEPLSPTSPEGRQRRRRPMALRSPPGRRRPQDQEDDEDFLSPTHSSLVTQFYPPEAPRSAPASTIAYNRSISGPIRMSRPEPEQSTSRLAEPGSLGRSQTSWGSPRSPPTTTQYHFPSCWDPSPSPQAPSSRSMDEPPTPLRATRTYPAGGQWEPWDASQSPPPFPTGHRRSSARVQTFDDETELHQFAEATSGFDPFSPVRTRPMTEYYAPRTYSHSQPLPQQPFPRNSMGLTRSTSQAIAEVLQAGEEDHMDDEELPDYEQSQAEAHFHQRREAAQRAAELERRWRDARRRTRSP